MMTKEIEAVYLLAQELSIKEFSKALESGKNFTEAIEKLNAKKQKTDLERMTELYQSFGFDFERTTREGFPMLITEVPIFEEEKARASVGGFGGFRCHDVFDENGKFIKRNIWE